MLWRLSLRRQNGQVLVLSALALPALFAMLALVVDGADLLVHRRAIQNAADASALAAAQGLPLGGFACTGPDTNPGTCLYTVRMTADKYSSQNGGSGNLHQCGTTAAGLTDRNASDCYATPYIDSAGTHNDLVYVRLRTQVNTFFETAAHLSFSHRVSARAIASRDAVTTTTPGTTSISSTPGVTTPGSTSTSTSTITTGGSAALMFARCGWGHAGDSGSPADACTGTSNECHAMHISGSNNTYYGAIVSNGGVQDSGGNFGAPPKGNAGLYYGPQYGPGNCLTTAGTWVTIKPLAARIDWPVAPPTLTCSDGKTYGGSVTSPNLPYACPSGTHPTKVNGVSCTLLSTAKFTVNSNTDPSGQPWHGLYCVGGALTINKTGITISDAGFIAPSIGWSSGGNVASGYTGLYLQYGGLFLDAYSNTGGLNWSGSSDSWTGAIFAPNDNAQVSGGGVTGVCAGVSGVSACGFIEGQTIQESGSDGVWGGLGPIIGATTTTTTTTTTYPGVTTPGTASTTITPGTTSTTGTTIGLGE